MEPAACGCYPSGDIFLSWVSFYCRKIPDIFLKVFSKIEEK
jgi:hypothetical protein